MNIAIFSPYATVAPHFETELEIAQRHHDAGDAVEYVACFGELAACDFNPQREQSRCEECIGRRTAGLLTLTPLMSSQDFSGSPSNADTLQFEFETVDELKSYKLDNFDIGYAALSSLVSLIRDPEPDLLEHQETLENCIRAAASVYRFTLQYINKFSPDRIYVFNGRFASMRAVLRACEKTETDCQLHERGCDTSHFETFDNHLPHDIDAIDKTIRRLWDSGNQDSNKADFRERAGAQWFIDRVNRVEKSWHSFTSQQQAGRLPDNWNAVRKNISIFCSSDDEFVAIGDQWNNELYPNQVDAIKRIADSMMCTHPATHLYLRVHPNLTNVDNQRKREMMDLSSPNLTIIAPDAEVDTYELMKSSDKVVSFGSSVGIEAVYWGRPSVLLGPCFYKNLPGVYRAQSHSHAIELLQTDLAPKEKTGALMYGFWFQTRGKKFKYFEPTGLFEGKFKGQVIHQAIHEVEASKHTSWTRKTKIILRRLLKAS